jgi:hypothetical protein
LDITVVLLYRKLSKWNGFYQFGKYRSRILELAIIKLACPDWTITGTV